MRKHMGKIKKFNNYLGDMLSYSINTMACFYIVCVAVIVPLMWHHPQSFIGWAQYSISVFFQGVALPLLGYTSQKNGERQDKLLKETHDVVMKELKILKDKNKEELP